MGAPAVTQVVVYGDLETVTTHQERVSTLSAQDNLEIVGWFHDPEGLRPIPEPSEAPGLVGALAECARAQVALHIPFPVDAPGEQRWRLIAHWLHTRGLRLLISGSEYVWDAPTDAIDYAVRQTLDAASNLAAAVVAKGAMPALEDLLAELLGDWAEPGGAALTTGVEAGRDVAGAQPVSQGLAQAQVRRTTRTVSDEPGRGPSFPDAALAESESDARAKLSQAEETITDLREEIGLLRRNLQVLEAEHRECTGCATIPIPAVINAEAVLAALPENWRQALGSAGGVIAVAPAGTQFFRNEEDKETVARAQALASELETLHQNAAEWVTEGDKIELSDQFQLALYYYEVASRSVKALVELLETEP
jgi:hypothetical protein